MVLKTREAAKCVSDHRRFLSPTGSVAGCQEGLTRMDSRTGAGSRTPAKRAIIASTNS